MLSEIVKWIEKQNKTNLRWQAEYALFAIASVLEIAKAIRYHADTPNRRHQKQLEGEPDARPIP